MADATAGQSLDSSRAHLNDVGATIWSNTVLFPFLQEAHRELRAYVILNGIPVINEENVDLTVPLGTTDLTTVAGYPVDLIVPIWLKEKQLNDDVSNYTDMTERDFLPTVDQDIWLFWWTWRHEKILLVGSLNDENIRLRYRRQIPTPSLVSDSLGWLNAEMYTSYRTAALACQSIGETDKAKILQDQADRNMDIVIRLNIKQVQTMPAKRRPYHRRYANQTIIRGI